MSSGAINASASRLRGIGLAPLPAPGSTQDDLATKTPASRDTAKISAAAAAPPSSGSATGATIKDQVLAIDSQASHLQADRDGILADIRGLEANKATVISRLADDQQKLADAQQDATASQAKLDDLQSVVAADQANLSAFDGRLASLHDRADNLASEAQALGTAHRNDYQRGYGATDYLHYLATLAPADVPSGSADQTEKDAKSPEAVAARAALAQDEQDIAANKAAQSAIASELARALANRKATEGKLDGDETEAGAASAQLSRAQAKVSELGRMSDLDGNELGQVGDRLDGDDERVRDLQSAIDQLEGERKTILASAINADQDQIAELDRRIAALKAQKALVVQDLTVLQALRGQ